MGLFHASYNYKGSYLEMYCLLVSYTCIFFIILWYSKLIVDYYYYWQKNTFFFFLSYDLWIYKPHLRWQSIFNLHHNPANIRLDENFLKTFFVLVFRRRLQDVLIKTIIFILVIRLQKTSWSRPICSPWPYVFKTSSRHL